MKIIKKIICWFIGHLVATSEDGNCYYCRRCGKASGTQESFIKLTNSQE